jgi:SMC interacting uncharacterized protein involved in chromosome segregation
MSIPRFSLGGQQNISILQPKTLFHRKSIAGLSQNFGTENLPPSRASFGRNSFGRSSLSRRSSYLMEGKGVLKDPRSLNDKEYRRESIAILVRYLTENGYEHPIGIKSFANPAMKDYLRIFKFLYNQLDPHRKFTSPNYVEELPALMKELGYPFNINKSTFLAWTPRAWTCLLGCLLWLGELCSYFKKVGPMCFFPLHDDNFEDEVQSQRETERIFFEYISKAYISYLEGDDDYEGGAELSVFAEKNNLLQQQLVDINVAIERETQKLKQLEEEPSRLKILQSARENALSEKRKLVSLINEYKQHVAQCTNKEAEVYKELEEKSSELERLLTEKRNLENILETQELSQMDVEKINNERYQLELDLKELESHKNEAKKLNWEREKEYKQFFSSLMNDFHVYHQKAMRLHLLPSTAKLAGGVDYQLLINEEHSNPHEMLFVKLKGGIKPNLAQLKEALLKNIVDLQEESALLEDHLEQVICLVIEYCWIEYYYCTFIFVS